MAREAARARRQRGRGAPRPRGARAGEARPRGARAAGPRRARAAQAAGARARAVADAVTPPERCFRTAQGESAARWIIMIYRPIPPLGRQSDVREILIHDDLISGRAQGTPAAAALPPGVPAAAVGPVPRLRPPAAHAVRPAGGGGHPRGGRPRQNAERVRAPPAAEVEPAAAPAAATARAAAAAGRARAHGAAAADGRAAGPARAARPAQERGAAMIAMRRARRLPACT